MAKTIAIGCDHAAVELKRELANVLQSEGHTVIDLGTHDTASVDYPDFANAVSHAVLHGKAELGVLACGSGIGMSMAANRHKGIRAALCHSGLEASLSRRHNNANILVLGARIIGAETAKDCLTHFLNTEFEGGRHEGRVAKMG